MALFRVALIAEQGNRSRMAYPVERGDGSRLLGNGLSPVSARQPRPRTNSMPRTRAEVDPAQHSAPHSNAGWSCDSTRSTNCIHGRGPSSIRRRVPDWSRYRVGDQVPVLLLPLGRYIRKLIDHKREELEQHGVCRTVRQTPGALGGRPWPSSQSPRLRHELRAGPIATSARAAATRHS